MPDISVAAIPVNLGDCAMVGGAAQLHVTFPKAWSASKGAFQEGEESNRTHYQEYEEARAHILLPLALLDIRPIQRRRRRCIQVSFALRSEPVSRCSGNTPASIAWAFSPLSAGAVRPKAVIVRNVMQDGSSGLCR